MDELDPYDVSCPIQYIFMSLGSKWAMLILLKLSEQPYQFRSLHRAIEGISPKVLTENLNKLHTFNLINRTEHHDAVITVSYELSLLGHSFLPVLQAFKGWAVEHREALLQNIEMFS